ncbi:hypothetical protein L596_026474 [Steinernema carpocapsae]|uniref:Uncharacterized protein n=1 Tax=Steinernema carpocapsae TaxID=34508 RepID=A0A4V5ZYF1_STECR|nr:hypothetical protein L596_026474 [Steinernema carpocapsae]
MESTPIIFLETVFRRNTFVLNPDDFSGNVASGIEIVQNNFVNLFIEVLIEDDLEHFSYYIAPHGMLKGVLSDLTLEQVLSKPHLFGVYNIRLCTYEELKEMKQGSWQDPGFLRLVALSAHFPNVAFHTEVDGLGLQFYERLLAHGLRSVTDIEGCPSQDYTYVDILKKVQSSDYFQSVSLLEDFVDQDLDKIMDLFLTSKAIYLSLFTAELRASSIISILKHWETFQGTLGCQGKRSMPDGNYETIEKLTPKLKQKCHVRKYNLNGNSEETVYEFRVTKNSKRGMLFKKFECPFVCEVHFVDFGEDDQVAVKEKKKRMVLKKHVQRLYKQLTQIWKRR